jgi:hypothetical protein
VMMCFSYVQAFTQKNLIVDFSKMFFKNRIIATSIFMCVLLGLFLFPLIFKINFMTNTSSLTHIGCNHHDHQNASKTHKKVPATTTVSCKTAGDATSGHGFTPTVKRKSAIPLIAQSQHYSNPNRSKDSECSIPLVGVVTGLTLESTRCIMSTLEHMSIVFVVESNNHSENVISGSHTLYLLNWDDQARMYPDLDEIIPRGNYARKNIGYLYALDILNACSIWDFDDDNCLTAESSSALSRQDFVDAPLEITGDESNNVNPYLLYGAPGGFIWPRGMPVETQSSRFFPRLSTRKSPSPLLDVVQFMQAVDPDVDAVWRLQNGKSLPLKWDTHTILKSTTVALGSWAPFNAQSTWLSRRAAMVAYLPFSVHGRVSDIWRSYIMQFLLGHQHIGFYGAFVDHHRNSHNYMADMQAESQLYEQAGALTTYLQNRPGCFSCSDCNHDEFLSHPGSNHSRPGCTGCSEQLSECYLTLLDDLYTRGFIEVGDVELGYKWIQAAGGSFELINAGKIAHQDNPGHSQKTSNMSRRIIAVLHVNSAMLSTVPLWMAIHGHQFKEVLAYVPGAPGCVPISGIPIQCISSDTRGFWAYESMVHAMETRLSNFQDIDSALRSLPFAQIVGGDTYSEAEAATFDAVPPPDSDIDGFLFTHDDVVWSSERVFFELGRAVIATDNFWSPSSEWMWTSLDTGARAMERFAQRYRRINGRYGQSDFFFIPLKQAPHFARVGKQMLHSGVFLELAVPSIIADFDSNTKYVNLDTSWDASRTNPSIMAQRAIDSVHGPYDLIHPVKLSSLSCVFAHLFFV